MMWTPGRNREQGLLVARMYQRAADVPCERSAVLIGGLRGADKTGALAEAGVDRSRYLTISIDAILEEMAACGLIPARAGLSPLDIADLVHAESQFLAKRLGLRALADGKNLIWDISMASAHVIESWLDTLRLAGYAAVGMFVDISIEESVRRSDAEHRRGHENYLSGRGHGGRYVPPEAIRALADTPSSRKQRHQATGIAACRCPADTAGVQSSGRAFPGGEVTHMIASYRADQQTLEGLAREFRARRWSTIPSACPPGLEAAAPAVDDPEPYTPGSFDDVILAYDLRQLSDLEYEALANAAAAQLPPMLGSETDDRTAENGIARGTDLAGNVLPGSAGPSVHLARLRDRVMRSEPSSSGLQLHDLADPPVTHSCPRCGWHGNVWMVATLNGDWTAPICECCYEDLHPDISVIVSYWSVRQASYLCTTPQEHMPFTVIRSRQVAGHLASRDEIYRPHLSQDHDVWEFTSVLVEEARDGSGHDVTQISEDAARAIMERTRARHLPG